MHVNEAEIKIPQGNGARDCRDRTPDWSAAQVTIPPRRLAERGDGQPAAERMLGRKHRIIRRRFGLSGGSSAACQAAVAAFPAAVPAFWRRYRFSGGSTACPAAPVRRLSGSTTTGQSRAPPACGRAGRSTGRISARSGALQTSGIGLNNLPDRQFGGGQIIGFASTSKKELDQRVQRQERIRPVVLRL